MYLRGAYIKTTDLDKTLAFWQSLLGTPAVPVSTDGYYEFQLASGKFGVSHNDYGDKYLPSNAVPVFQVTRDEGVQMMEQAVGLGAKLIFNGIDTPNRNCIVLADPQGNEFELSAVAT